MLNYNFYVKNFVIKKNFKLIIIVIIIFIVIIFIILFVLFISNKNIIKNPYSKAEQNKISQNIKDVLVNGTGDSSTSCSGLWILNTYTNEFISKITFSIGDNPIKLDSGSTIAKMWDWVSYKAFNYNKNNMIAGKSNASFIFWNPHINLNLNPEFEFKYFNKC